MSARQDTDERLSDSGTERKKKKNENGVSNNPTLEIYSHKPLRVSGVGPVHWQVLRVEWPFHSNLISGLSARAKHWL